MKTLTLEQARLEGYQPLTDLYSDSEKWMLDNVLRDMERGHIDHCLVTTPEGTMVWRKGCQFGNPLLRALVLPGMTIDAVASLS